MKAKAGEYIPKPTAQEEREIQDEIDQAVESARFGKGNQLWKFRESNGRSKKYDSVDSLWLACTEYFQWVHDNPLMENKVAQFQGEVVKMTMPKMRAMTKEGLYIFLSINRQTWVNYRGLPEFKEVCETVEMIIRQQKFEGAAADLFNASIISRDLGLADKIESKSMVVEIAKDATPQEAANAYKTLMGE